jgi:hypothetical protein
MDPAQLFDVWAPPSTPWSAWAKPALFVPSFDLSWTPARATVPHLPAIPSASARAALILDMEGDASVNAGLQAAKSGYRPVPLFNACPAPANDEFPLRTTVEVSAIHRALVSEAVLLSQLHIPADAPPAFLLDSQRAVERIAARPGVFDNRSVVFESDFPSAQTLLRNGITRVRIVHRGTGVGADLLHSLAAWKKAGIAIDCTDISGEPIRLRWPVTGALGRFFVHLLSWLRFQRAENGAFGGVIAESSGG